MKILRRCIYGGFLAFAANLLSLFPFLGTECSVSFSTVQQSILIAVCSIGWLLIMLRPQKAMKPVKRIQTLDNGCELLRLFLISASATVLIQIGMAAWVFSIVGPWDGLGSGVVVAYWLISLLCAVLVEVVVFWSGMIRLYITSIQLGIKHRVLGALCGWIPGLNIYYLRKLICIASAEVETETQKHELDAARVESEVCKTKYPILLVHGVFFRDFRYLNYWGRIPRELQKNGASVYYGQQQSAASVIACGEELAAHIRSIVNETGCEKVNIIAHSKGGLDSRAAITQFGVAPYVASLTTINTPHNGCIFAEYLLGKMPDKVRMSIADTYNAALKKLGDSAPDFLSAVKDLTESACLARNETTPDMPGVLYESVMSYCKKAQSGKFPLNVSYPLVKHFDGKNDGLVSVDSARWGTSFTLVEPSGARGISHGDMIDLNRENIAGFDVREFYVTLVSGLKRRGC